MFPYGTAFDRDAFAVTGDDYASLFANGLLHNVQNKARPDRAERH